MTIKNEIKDYNSNVKTGLEAFKLLKTGIDLVADVVKSTIGSRGRNSILQLNPPYNYITNDGVSIAKHIFHKDPFISIGVDLIKEVAGASDKDSGDGTTTTTILTQAILNEYSKYINNKKNKNINSMSIKIKLDELLKDLIENLKSKSIKIEKENFYLVGKIAKTSAEVEHLADIIYDCYVKYGKDVAISLEKSENKKTYIKPVQGYRIKSPLFLGLPTDYLKNPYVIFSETAINSLDQMDTFLEYINNNKEKNYILFVREIENSVITQLMQICVDKKVKIYIVKPSIFSEYYFEDLSILVGATVIGQKSGISWANLQYDQLDYISGKFDEVTIVDTDVIFTGTKKIQGKILEHYNKLKKAFEDKNSITSGHDEGLRYQWMSQNAVFVYLGANTEAELSYLKLKSEDCINACYLALQEGIVTGGGTKLVDLSNSIKGKDIASTILKKALLEPAKQIAINAGNDNLDLTKFKGEIGFDSSKGEYCNLFKQGVVDPVLVLINALKNSVSLAGTVLTTDSIAFLPRVEYEKK